MDISGEEEGGGGDGGGVDQITTQGVPFLAGNLATPAEGCLPPPSFTSIHPMSGQERHSEERTH